MEIINFLLNLLFPMRCLSCGHLGSYLCRQCSSIVQAIELLNCPVCKKPAIDGATHPKCKTGNSLDGLVFFWRYKGIAHKIIHKIKYNPFIFTAIEEIINYHTTLPKNPTLQDLLSRKPLLVPVPLHRSRLRYRGYNHAEKIAEAFAKKWHLKAENNLLLRIKKTKPQANLKLEERKSNIKNAFAVKLSFHHIFISSSHFILVDDVWTSGSTLSECCRVLKQSGAQKVWALTLAR